MARQQQQPKAAQGAGNRGKGAGVAAASTLSDAASDTPTKASTRATTTSTTASGFAARAFDNGVLNPASSRPPDLAELQKRLAARRESSSPPASCAFEVYKNKVDSAVNEVTMLLEVSGALLKDHQTKGYPRAASQAFTAFPRDVGFNNELSAPQPDFVEGLEAAEYRPFPVSSQVPGAVLYKDNPRAITLAHVAGELKGPGKDMERARLQSAYDGAALVYARNQRDPPGHAAVTTFTTDGKQLYSFAHYAAVAPTEEEFDQDGNGDTEVEYHQYQLQSITLVNSHDEFKKGRSWLRNQQDLAKEQSYALKDELKKHWRQRHRAVRKAHQTATGAPRTMSGADDVTENVNIQGGDEVVSNAGKVCRKRKASAPPTPHSTSRHWVDVLGAT
ncbi:hypothetical protein SCUCBS95973_007017 [Sporothrix curviconia]|uniref:Uncharacterized protein n=1 Tax=Sporothrix curviconia TaxID=1260050 RepID=A0ABP0CBI8_9PEZI